MSIVENKLNNTIQRIITLRKDLEVPAFLGDKSGNIKADAIGNVYVTFWNGETMVVRNQAVPNQRRWVIVGYKNNVLQVLRTWDVFSDNGAPDVPDHDHTWGKSANPSWIRREQFLDGLAVPGIGLTVDFYGCWFQLDGVAHALPNQTIDLTAQIPTSDARWCNVEVDASSVISFNVGSSKANRELLLPEDIPATAATKRLLFSVKTYVGQTIFIKEVGDTDFFDARFTGMGSGPALAVDWTNITGVPATFPPDTTITDALYPKIHYSLIPPTATDDETVGFKAGDIWVDGSGLIAYIAVDVSTGAAVWFAGSGGGGGGGGVGAVGFWVDGALDVVDDATSEIVITADTTISFWYFRLKNTGTSDSSIFDIVLNGSTSILNDGVTDNRPVIAWDDADGWIKVTALTSSFVEGDILTLNIDQVASGGTSGLTVTSNGISGSSGGSLTVNSISPVNGITFAGDASVVDDGGGAITVTVGSNVIDTTLVQQKSNGASTASLSLVMDAAPTPGNILVLYVGNTSNRTNTVSQTGVTWTAQTRYTSTNSVINLFIGVVGSSPDVTITIANTGGGFILGTVSEWTNLTGTVDSYSNKNYYSNAIGNTVRPQLMVYAHAASTGGGIYHQTNIIPFADASNFCYGGYRKLAKGEFAQAGYYAGGGTIANLLALIS